MTYVTGMSDTNPVIRTGKIFIGFCLVLACVAAGAFGTQLLLSDPDGEGDDDARNRQAIRVDVTTPQMRDIDEQVTGIGSLRPVRRVDIVPNAAGRIAELPVSSLQEVAEGDLLIQLDDRTERATLADAQATFDEAELELQRVTQLAESNAAAQAQLEEARATLRRAEAAVMTAATATDDRAITAPFAGTLGVIEAEVGGLLEAGAPVTRLSDLTAVEVIVALPEQYYDRVAPGQSLELTTPAYPDEVFAGEVTLRGTEIDLGTRSFEIRAQIDNPDQRLIGGMFASTRLVLDTYQALAIPDDAIISEGLSTYVYSVVDDTAERTSIQTGQSLGDLTEITDGLSPDDKIVIAGWDQLSDGAPVEVAKEISAEDAQ